MLSYLRITNFAIIEEVELELGPGMTVLSGETGAGKSLILESVALLRGGRAHSELIRDGADEATIEAVFCLKEESPAFVLRKEKFEKLGIDPQSVASDGLLVRRVVLRGGRSRIHLQGQLVTAAALADLCGGLIDLSGQHEHQTLLEVGQHLALLDRFGVHAPLQKEMSQAHAALWQAHEALLAASVSEKQRSEREEFLRFQLDELDRAEVTIDEDEVLRQEQKRLRHADRLHLALGRSEARLQSGDDSVLDGLALVQRELQQGAAVAKELEPLAERLREAQALLGDVAHELRRFVGSLHADPERLAHIEDRLHLLSRLCRKHGPDLAAVLAKHKTLRQELETLGAHEQRRAQAQTAVCLAKERACLAAQALTDKRKEVAEVLAQRMERELAELAMSGGRLRPELMSRRAERGDDPSFTTDDETDKRCLSKQGWDRCELLFSANPGETLRPLRKIASGGELSRVMLALRGVLGQADQVTTCVFDEVDAGQSGATADRVGRKIRRLAEGKQVLCISHLSQIAAYANEHFLVEKIVENGRALTRVRKLAPAERRDEMARMIGGGRLTQKSRAHADELLAHAGQGSFGKRKSPPQPPETNRPDAQSAESSG